MIVTIFGSSQVKAGSNEYETARRLGKLLAEAGYTVCNGGYVGTMEASARGAKKAGGKTIGVTAEELGGRANRWIDREIRVGKWRDRLFKLIEMGDAYVILDGSTGTLAELFVVWEMSNKKLITKPFFLLGKQIQSVVRNIQKWPQVIQQENLLFVKTVEEIMKQLRSKIPCSI